MPGRAAAVVAAARERGVNLRLVDDDHVGVSTAETTGRTHLEAVLAAVDAEGVDLDAVDGRTGDALPDGLHRSTEYLTHPVFHTHRSETAMLRYLRRLSDRDYALDRGMIPLGSCTMKLNATTEMEPITCPGSRTCTRSRRSRTRPATGRWSPSSRAGWPRSPGTTRCRCSPTPGRRASWPACWRSAPTTSPTGTTPATCA